MVLSRAAFGVTRQPACPSVLSWVLTVGWETVLVSLATLATAQVFDQLGWGGGTATKIVALLVVAAPRRRRRRARLRRHHAHADRDHLGHRRADRRLHRARRRRRWTGPRSRPCRPARPQAFIGALVLVMTGFGFGWVNAAADYSRYLPRAASTAASSAGRRSAARSAPVVLLVFGLLLAGSRRELSAAIGARPDRRAGHAAADLVPGAVRPRRRARPGRRRAAGHLLLRPVAARRRACGSRAGGRRASTACSWSIGTIYVVFFADNFIGPFQGFLITLGVPIAAWCGVHAGRHRAAQARLRRGRALRPARPVRQRAGRSRSALRRARHGARLGPGHQRLRRLAGLAGLPARAARARRQGRRLGVRQPRRAGRASPSACSARCCCPATGSGPRRHCRSEPYGRAARIAPANRSADPGAAPRNSDGSASSTSTTTGAPSSPGSRSTRA